MTTATVAAGTRLHDSFERVGLLALVACLVALQFSIAAAQILLTVVLLCWAGSLASRHTPPDAPPFFWVLMLYAGATLVSATFSRDPHVSFMSSKQLVLYLLVPAVYQLARGRRALTLLNVIITVGAASAAFGIIQYGILEYDYLGQRPHGTLGHYMTYSGLLLLVIAAALARVLFERRDRVWPALVLPALLVAVVLTLTRSAWVGVCAVVALLLAFKDFRLLPVLPVLAAIFFALAPARVTDRFYSTFDLKDPTSRDRIAMLHEGVKIVRDRPLTGVGPNMVPRVYAEYRDPTAGDRVNPHLHNVPMQIAAERGLPALLIWIAFIIWTIRDLVRLIGKSRYPSLPTAALAALVGMLAAGMFEYNFGDSEFLMLLLVLLTLPFAAEAPPLDSDEGRAQ